MKEYIEREAATAHPIIVKIGPWEGPVVPVETVNAVPAADVVEVVRCRDCQWGLVGKQNVICMKHSPVVPRTHDFDYFCADGERKDERRCER